MQYKSKTVTIRLTEDLVEWLTQNDPTPNQRGKSQLIADALNHYRAALAQGTVQDTVQDDVVQVQDIVQGTVQDAIDAALAPVMARIEALEK